MEDSLKSLQFRPRLDEEVNPPGDYLPTDVSRCPSEAQDADLIKRLKWLGKSIKNSRRRFIALLPEIEKRKLYLQLKYDDTADLAYCEAHFSPGVVSKVLRTAKYLEPFKAIKRLFEKSDIGWTKFAVVAPVLTKDNANDFLWHLKNRTSKSSLEEMVRIAKEEKRRLEGVAIGSIERGSSARSSSAFVSSAIEQSKPIGQVHQFKAINGQVSRDACPNSTDQNNLFNQSKDETPEEVIESQVAGKAYGVSGTGICTCTCGCNHKKGVGQIFYVAGKAAVNVTLYASVAEALFQRADMLEVSKSKIADLSKVIEGLLYSNLELSNFEPSNSASNKSNNYSAENESYKLKREREVIVVTHDKDKELYSSRSRKGDFEVEANEVKETSKNFDEPLDLHAMRERAIARAEEYMDTRLSLGKELTDYIPKLIEDYLFFRSKGYFCEFPGCNCRGFGVHHLDRFAINRSCRPDRLVVLCIRHHKLAHDGAMGGEDGPISGLHIDVSLARRRAKEGSDAERAKVDAKYRHMRAIAARNRHQPVLC